MPYENYTDPREIRPGTRKERLCKVWFESRNEIVVYTANANFANDPASKGPVKEATVAGWLRWWIAWEAQGNRWPQCTT